MTYISDMNVVHLTTLMCARWSGEEVIYDNRI